MTYEYKPESAVRREIMASEDGAGWEPWRSDGTELWYRRRITATAADGDDNDLDDDDLDDLIADDEGDFDDVE